MNDHLMNDTFDNFTLSDLKNDFLTSDFLSQFNDIKAVTLLNNNSEDETKAPETVNHKDEISFDDSLFFSGIEFTQEIEKSGENQVKEDGVKISNVQISISISRRDEESTPKELFNLSEEREDHSSENQSTNNQEDVNNFKATEEIPVAAGNQHYNKDNEKLYSLMSDSGDIFEESLESEPQADNSLVSMAPEDIEKFCDLSLWGLPEPILEKYHAKNIKKMFPWQVECLNSPRVLKTNSNLVYSAPTSAGKTLVSELLTIKTIIERRKKVIFILPFVSVVREKMFYFQEIFSSSGIRVEGFMGSYNPPGGFKSVQLAICTIEKANSLVNKLLQEESIADIGAVVIDEMHLLGDPSRGYLLELLLTKLRYISLRNDDVKIQIIGMSATLPNLETLAKWLDADLYITSFRPIPLYEQAHVCGEIYDNNLKLIRRLTPLPDLDTDTDNILQLCLETIKESCSVLIFCPTKNWCENLAQQISNAFWKLGTANNKLGLQLREQLKSNLISELLQQLRFCPVGLDDILRKTVSFGVAFHHAGLTMDERDIIEGAFRNGAIRVLVATSTLSSGVNLPARRVIIRTPTFHGKPIDTLTYRQMIGRAGRMGKDTAGESILVCQKNDYKVAKSLMSAQLEPVESCLEGEGKLKRAILEVVASGVASSPEDVQLFTNCTLLAQNEKFDDPIGKAVEFLINNEFIRLQDREGVNKYVATSLGKACLSSSIPPEEGLALFTELEKARQCFVLETELHLIYLVTPYTACHQWGNIDWMFYLNLWEKLPSSMKKVGELVGVREAYIVSATRGKIQTNTAKLYHKLLVHKRFFVSLALQDLVNEMPLSDVSNKFNCNRGMLQSLQLTASTFAGMVTAFSRQLGWSSVEILISQFQDRLHFGVSRDLLDLMRLPILNCKSARALFNAGIETVVQLANSDVSSIENILHKVVPFESGKVREGESEFALKERNKFKNIWITGKEGLTEREAAELLLTNARDYLQIEMGLKEAKWDKSQDQSHNENENEAKNDVMLPETNSKDKISLNISNYSDRSLFSVSCTGDSGCKVNSDQSLFEDGFHLNSTPAKGDSSETSINDALVSNYCRRNNSSRGSLNSSSDFVTASQDESYISLSDITNRTIRKRSRIDKQNDFFIINQQSPRKKKKMSKKRSFVQNDASEDVKLTEMEIVDVCSHEKIYDSFCNEIMLHKYISFSIACTRVEESVSSIGLKQNIVQKRDEKYVYKNVKVTGFAVSWGSNVVYYLDLAKMDKCVHLILDIAANKDFTFKIFDCKEQIKILERCCNVTFKANVEDPKIGDWLLQPEEEEKNLQAMLINYCTKCSDLLDLCDSNKGVRSISLNLRSSTDPKLRSCIESLATWYVVDAIKESLKKQDKQLLAVYTIEMDCLKVLAHMEINGMGVNKSELTNLISTLKTQLTLIEKKAYALAGRRFSFTSTKEVAKVLGIFKGRKVSTKKQILEKCENPIADLVLQWRKLSGTITKMIMPLVRVIEQDRIYGNCIMHTSTGRISMHEPNLQNIAKNYEIIDPTSGEKIAVACRNAFCASSDCILVSADYCQLELRLLAHLSKDPLLCKIMKQKGDVFKSIAAKWNRISESEVTDNLRQHAKQICYGIIYGMGSKALSEQLNIEEAEAAKFMESFRNSYSGVKMFVKKVIENCRLNGYVETLAGRRRYLPHINHKNPAIKSQAERQAVNTTIQGSAADVVKKTMIELEKSLMDFSRKPLLVLHLHDELLYEVPKVCFKPFVDSLKTVMEGSVKLAIPFPIKIKSGTTWGQLTEYVV